MSRIVSIRLPTVHSPTSPPTHSSQPLRASTTLRATGSITSPTTGGSAAEHRVDRRRALAFLADQREDRRAGDEEREDRQHRHVGEVAGVDEAVVVGADQHPLGDLERRGCPGPTALATRLRQPGLVLERVLAPRLGRERRGPARSSGAADGVFVMSPCRQSLRQPCRGLPLRYLRPMRLRRPACRADCGCRVQPSSRVGQVGDVVGQVDLERDQLVAALAVLAREALALEPQHLARCPRRARPSA